MSENKFYLCDLDELTDPGSMAFSLSLQESEIEGFIVRLNDHLSAFINSCPHTGASLNWNPHQFLDVDGEFIQCSLHGALFRPNDGLCVRGPCVGQSLQALPVTLEHGAIWLYCD